MNYFITWAILFGLLYVLEAFAPQKHNIAGYSSKETNNKQCKQSTKLYDGSYGNSGNFDMTKKSFDVLSLKSRRGDGKFFYYYL